MGIPRDVQRGDPPVASHYNAIKNQAFRGLRGGGGIRVVHGSRETLIVGPRIARIGLFQLTQGWTLPDPGTYAQGVGDVAYTQNAQPVWLDDRASVNEYNVSTDSYTRETLYAPCGFLNAGGLTVGHPPAASGQRVWATQSANSGRWEVLAPAHDVVRFQLTEALTTGSNATANLLPWTGAAYAEDSDVQFEVYDSLSRFAMADDAKGYAKWMPDVGRWEVIVGTTVAKRKFELYDALTPSGNATAYLRTWGGSSWSTDTGTTFTVYDVRGVYRGKAKGAGTGSYGEAEYNQESSRWEIVWLQPHALRITCTADGTVATTDTTFSVTGVTIMQPTGAILLATVTTIYNVFAWAIDNGGLVHACWNESNQHWEAVQAKCPA